MPGLETKPNLPKRPPPPTRPERVVRERGPKAAALIRLLPGQRPAAIVATDGEVEASRRTPMERCAVTAATYRLLKLRWRTRKYWAKNAYMAHPRILADVKAWAEATLAHVPRPGNDTGAGSSASELAESLEAWLNDRRWPVEITGERMSGLLRDLGYGARCGRWNCAPRTVD